MFFLFFDPDASKVASKVGKGQVGQKKGGGTQLIIFEACAST